MIRLDFVCTACRRPGIARETFASFAAYLRGVDLRASTLYLNIDPIPAEGDAGSVILAAREYFGAVRANTPPHPCFPAALKWCWRQPAGEFFFHLEDDWHLCQQIDVEDMAAKLRADPGLCCVHLRAYSSKDDGRICLAPGLWRTEQARGIAERLVLMANPERQCRPAGANNPHGGKHLGLRGLHYPDRKIVLKDLGRPWMARAGLRRDGGRDFIRWAS